MMHLGVNGQKHCGESTLLAGDMAMDIGAVDCLPCLWKMLSESMKATDRIAFRIKLVTDEQAGTKLALGPARARG